MSYPKNKKGQAYVFNPYELAFCGYSQTGKTTLITRLLKDLSQQYQIGYIKHDAHSFDMDHEGKDTFQAMENGARMVFISDPNHFAQIQNGSADSIAHQNIYLDNDFVFVEGYKDSVIPKILFIDKNGDILKDIKNNQFQNVIAYIGSQKQQYNVPSDGPYFHFDDIENIKQHILSYFQRQTQSIPLYGLVLAGGRSTRMKKDKSRLRYYGKEQSLHCCELLSQYCDQAFLSTREEQVLLSGEENPPPLRDMFVDIGPLGGILTALTKFPVASWLVLACDLPFVDNGVIETLIKGRNPFKGATAFQSTKDAGLPEPLCAIYEPKIIFRLLQFMGRGFNCPRTILMNSDTHLIGQDREYTLNNINDPREYQEAVDIIKNMGRKPVV